MGSIINIWTDPKKWYIETTPNPLFTKTTSEELLKAHVGVGDYDYHGADDVVIYVRKSIYEKLISGEYIVKRNQIKLVIENKNGNLIKPFYEDGQFVY